MFTYIRKAFMSFAAGLYRKYKKRHHRGMATFPVPFFKKMLWLAKVILTLWLLHKMLS